jgi:hypothetical protein
MLLAFSRQVFLVKSRHVRCQPFQTRNVACFEQDGEVVGQCVAGDAEVGDSGRISRRGEGEMENVIALVSDIT